MKLPRSLRLPKLPNKKDFLCTLGLLLMIVGVCFGVYVGVWLCFIGGIVQVITEIKAEEIVPLNIGFGIFRVVAAGFIGVMTAFFAVIPGYILYKEN
jgi:hypothetical protein